MILAADFGGSTIKVGLVRNGAVVARIQLEAECDRPLSERLEAVAGAWEGLLQTNGLRLSDGRAIALALPFLISLDGSKIMGEFGKFPGATGLDFKAWGQKRLGLPVTIENDLRAALLGEWTAGAARGKSHVVMLAFGTGIGCAVITDGRLMRGAGNRAALLMGHGTITREGAPGRCGNIGCAEDLASTATLPSLARRLPGLANSGLARAPKIDYATVFRLARAGDACAKILLHQSLEIWSIVVLNAVIAYDPEIVVLGGGVMRSHDLILPAIYEHLRCHTPGLPLPTTVVSSALGDDAALLGGEVVARQTLAIRRA